MAIIDVSRTINAPLEKVFQTWGAEFSDIYKFNPNLKNSYVMANSPTPDGVGSLRQCDLVDGKNWLRERVVTYKQDQEIAVDIYESSLPLKSGVATFYFKSINPTTTKVTFKMDFQPGMGLLGKLLLPMMKANFKKSMTAALAGNAAYAESGKQANPTRMAA